ncbi:FtsX-like permease family protein [Segetibacter sp.]|jgi:lipoprotein-releasing system permease protein|uniref:FtsX-like permease family protein n=1 Tax=Segetibacter sp. TaxID=2231182 RepID=UPI0026255BB0|nr:FtsX-like permease family protein [Segetibacter sp.]MCW3081336.1 lipoprotein releasing system transrane protein LolC [Segetibacter sp.]
MTILFAWRYFVGKKTTNAINLIAWISILAIAVGAAALILVLSVFNGFEDLVKGLYADFYTDIRIAPAKGKFITLTPQQLQQIKGTAGVKQICTITEEKAVLVNNEYQSIIYLKGVDSQYTNVSGLASHIKNGKYDVGSADKPALVLGGGIENAVGSMAGMNLNQLTVYLPNVKATNFSGLDALNSYNVDVTGSFNLQQDFDNKYAITNIGFLKFMLDLDPDQYSAVEVALNNTEQTEQVKNTFQKLLGKNFKVETRYQQNQSLYTVMQVEKWVIYAILSLILVVAAFNMIGALTMLVLEKQKDIAVLKSMGADESYIQRIFLNEGFVLSVVGGGSGILIAVLICMLQIKFKLVKLSGSSFIIDYYPVKMVATDFLAVIATVMFISLLAAWIPSKKASKQHFSLKS